MCVRVNVSVCVSVCVCVSVYVLPLCASVSCHRTIEGCARDTAGPVFHVDQRHVRASFASSLITSSHQSLTGAICRERETVREMERGRKDTATHSLSK